MSEPSPDQFAQMREATEDHERFKPFEGTFRSEVKMWMGPGEPMVMTGTMVNELDLDGLFLKQTYEGDPSDGPFPAFAGRGWWGYNKVDGRYEGVWIDNASTVLQLEYGQVDDSGKVWEMKGEMTDPGSGATITKRSVITLVDDDHHTMEMYFGGPEGESKAMEIDYERKS